MYQNIYYERRINKMHIWDDKAGYHTFRYKKYAYTKNRNGNFISLYGDRLTRINKWEREQPDLFEADVNPEIRVLVDNYTDSDEPSVGHRTMIFDIEVEIKGGFPDPKESRNKITAIAIYDKVFDEYTCFILGSVKNYKKGKVNEFSYTKS